MKHRGRLLGESGKVTMVSPLVDLLFNMMITMFLFLMIYMAVVTPKNDDDLALEFLASTLPAASVHATYETNVGVRYGSGHYLFLLGGPRATNLMHSPQGPEAPPDALVSQRPGIESVHIDPATGHISAVFYPDGKDDPSQGFINIVVVDRERRVRALPDRLESWGNVPLFFHQEQEQGPNGSEQPGMDLVDCFVAIRKQLQVDVRQVDVPYDLEDNPLRLSGDLRYRGTGDGSLDVPLRILGGIEPYEARMVNGPSWLKLEALRFRPADAAAAVPAAGTYPVTLEIKDRQTLSATWEDARVNATNVGRPYQRVQVELTLDAPLQGGRLALPRYGRQGEPVEGAVIVDGGVGAVEFTATGLPPGLTLSPTTGRIAGTPTGTGEFDIVIRIRDQHPDSQKNSKEHRSQWTVVPARPRPRITSGGTQ